MLWVVENLQEELFRSQEYRLKAEKQQQEDRGAIDQLQVRRGCLQLTAKAPST